MRSAFARGKVCYLIGSVLWGSVSCTQPRVQKWVQNDGKVNVHSPQERAGVVATFGTVRITRSDYERTKAELQDVVAHLNRITAERDYHKWLVYLSDAYRRAYSMPDILQQSSDALPKKGVRLRNLRDYFIHVFVPSRQNVRVDSIVFESPTRVDVIMNHGGKALLVYKIEKIHSAWKLLP